MKIDKTNKVTVRADFFIWIEEISTKIIITVSDGEIIYAYHSGVEEEDNKHDLSSCPRWDSVKRYLEKIYDYESPDFIEIFKMLNKNSKGYPIAKSFFDNEIISLEERKAQIKEILAENS